VDHVGSIDCSSIRWHPAGNKKHIPFILLYPALKTSLKVINLILGDLEFEAEC
jgi:hypothetical protein